MTCSWRWFIHPETAISKNWNGSSTLCVFKTHYLDCGAAVAKHRIFMQIQFSDHTPYRFRFRISIKMGGLPLQEEADRLEVFLCHSSGDKAVVRNLHHWLKSAGMKAWLDETDILPGHDWDFEIRKAVRRAHVVLVCLSSASITKAGYGMHLCYGRMINGVQLPALVQAIVQLPNLRRVSGRFRPLLYEGPFPDRLVVEFGDQA